MIPKEVGVAKPWNFLCNRQNGSRVNQTKLNLKEEQQAPEKQSYFESVSSQIKRDRKALKVRNLRKVFSNGKVAVDDASMTLYAG